MARNVPCAGSIVRSYPSTFNYQIIECCEDHVKVIYADDWGSPILGSRILERPYKGLQDISDNFSERD